MEMALLLKGEFVEIYYNLMLNVITHQWHSISHHGNNISHQNKSMTVHCQIWQEHLPKISSKPKKGNNISP